MSTKHILIQIIARHGHDHGNRVLVIVLRYPM